MSNKAYITLSPVTIEFPDDSKMILRAIYGTFALGTDFSVRPGELKDISEEIDMIVDLEDDIDACVEAFKPHLIDITDKMDGELNFESLNKAFKDLGEALSNE